MIYLTTFRVQIKAENASPAKNTDAEGTVCPLFNPRIADAVQLTMIAAMNRMTSLRRASWDFMHLKLPN